MSGARAGGQGRRSWQLGAMLGALMLSGCAVGPDYTEPVLHLLPFHNRVAAAPLALSAAAPALDSWWTGFDDRVLIAVVQRALEQNLDLAAAFARVQQAHGVAAAAGAELLPTVDLDASATAERLSLVSSLGALGQGTPGFKRDQREYNVDAAASWEIDIFGGLRRSAAAATAEA